jgi:hypothetical protein
MKLEGRLLSDALQAVERCAVVYSAEGMCLALHGATLRTFSIDELSAVATFGPDELSSGVFGRGWPLVLVVSGHKDFVFVSTSPVLPFVTELQAVKVERKTKFIHYQLRGFDDFIMQSVTNGTIRWNTTDPADFLIPFPHSRLDFLLFHKNRSVMSKLSSFGDASVEITTDNVDVTSAAFLADAQQQDSGLAWDDVEYRLKKVSKHVDECSAAKVAEIVLETGCIVTGCVLIVSDRALYLTERTGALRLRVPLADITTGQLVATDDSGQRLSAAMLVLRYGAGDVLWLRSKFAADVMHRMNALQTSFRSLTVEGVKRNNNSSSPLAVVAFSPDPTVGRRSQSRPAVPAAVGPVVDKQMQTDLVLTVVESDPDVLLQQIAELREELKQKSLIVAFRDQLTKRHGGSGMARGRGNNSAAAAKNTTNDTDEPPVWIYAALLENEVRRLTNLELEQRVLALEETFADSDDPRMLAYTAREAQRRAQYWEDKVRELRGEMKHMHDAHQAAMGDLVAGVRSKVHDALQAQQELRQQDFARRAADHDPWKFTGNVIADVEARVQEEVTVRMAALQATMASLTDELRKREEQIYALGAELDGYFGERGDQTTAAQCSAAIRKIADRAASAREVGALANTKSGLDAKVRALMRQLDDLKQARDVLIEEGRTIYGAIAHAVSSGPEELERLRAEVDALRRMAHVQLFVAQHTELFRVADEAEATKVRAVEAAAALREKTEDLHRLEVVNRNLSRELATFRSNALKAEKELVLLRQEKSRLEAHVAAIENKHRRDVADLRQQLKRQRGASLGAGVRSFSRTGADSREPSPTTPERAPVTAGRDRSSMGRVPPLELPDSPPPTQRQSRSPLASTRAMSTERTRAVSIEPRPFATADTSSIGFGVVPDAMIDDPVARTKDRFAKMKQRLEGLL